MFSELRVIEQKLELLKLEYGNNLKAYTERLNSGVRAFELENITVLRKETEKKIKTKEREISDMEKRIEIQQKKLIELNKDKKMLEILKNNQLNSYNERLRKSEEIFIEEFVQAAIHSEGNIA